MSGSLTHSPADVVRHLLIALSQGTLPSDSGSWPVYCGRIPSTPDSAIVVLDTEGVKTGRTMPDGEQQGMHGVQIHLRSTNHAAVFTKARTVAVQLDTQVNRDTVTISSSTYLVQSVSRVGDPIAVGKDVDTKRDIFTINALVSVRQTS